MYTWAPAPCLQKSCGDTRTLRLLRWRPSGNPEGRVFFTRDHRRWSPREPRIGRIVRIRSGISTALCRKWAAIVHQRHRSPTSSFSNVFVYQRLRLPPSHRRRLGRRANHHCRLESGVESGPSVHPTRRLESRVQPSFLHRFAVNGRFLRRHASTSARWDFAIRPWQPRRPPRQTGMMRVRHRHVAYGSAVNEVGGERLSGAA